MLQALDHDHASELLSHEEGEHARLEQRVRRHRMWACRSCLISPWACMPWRHRLNVDVPGEGWRAGGSDPPLPCTAEYSQA